MMARSVALFAALIALFAGAAFAASDDTKSDLVFGVFSPECFETFFTKFDFLHIACIKGSISKLLSYAIIGGAFALKLPQMKNIVSAGDTLGLSAFSLYMDVAAFLPTPVYNILNENAFSTYGEALVVLVENMILVGIFWYFCKASERPSPVGMIGIAASGAALTAAFFTLPAHLWWTMPGISVVFTILTRIPQIYTNYTNGYTGQLSVVTWFLNLAGALARVFTTIQDPSISEASRPLLLGGFLIGASLSLTILLQIVWYWEASQKAIADAKATKAKKGK